MADESKRREDDDPDAWHPAFDQLYERYHLRLVSYARRQIQRYGIDPAAADGSDVAHDGWKSFLSWAKAAANRQSLSDAEDVLWKLLTTFVARKVIRRLRLQRRGGVKLTTAPSTRPVGPQVDGIGDLLSLIEGREIDPLEASIIADTIECLRRTTADDRWATMVIDLTLAGRTTAEVVAALRREVGMSQASAYRQVKKVKLLCARLNHDEDR